ncbi:Gfo/Idh/MocA family protein [Paenibacillus oceani]|uniref:Gfo/Idh/MocA family oxidoreductase n=1 Tax=Paenibacillus oceani TaxID=2772510 RepID=A0A927CC70_9BACL|nr:Gfo/Idh/MocA family oxidoreductase [Paenibacillus oceani]MBD2863185.1 Gfo/Idh/MocA family oxidoreductase [Paenibacillus oceani]
MTKIRTAVVGLNMGLGHARAYALSDKADLRWVVDLDEEKAAKVAEQLGCGYTTDWEKALDDVEAISIATPHHLHLPMGLKAIAAGKHVLMEKPLANSEEQAWELIRAAEAQHVVLMVAYIVRYFPAAQRLIEAIANEEYGKPLNANCFLEGYLPPAPDSWFANKEKLGGGVLFSHGCHYIDLLQAVLGNPVEVAGLGTRLGTEWMEGEGTHHGIMKFESGVLAHITSSWGIKHKNPPALLQIHTTEGCYELSFRSGLHKLVVRKGTEVIALYEDQLDPNRICLAEVEHFLDCIRSGHKPLTDGYEAMKSHQIIWSMYRHQGTPINLKITSQ